jgi:16S rRNA processing protein RimM
MTIDSCFQFGKIIKPHGLKGELTVSMITEHADHLKNMKSVYLSINDRLVPFFIEKLTLINKTKAIVQLEDVASEMDAEAYSGTMMYAPLAVLPPLKKDQFYYHEVIGYMVIDSKLGSLGTVDQIYEMPGQDLIAVIYHQSEVLIPISEKIVLSADHSLKTVYVHLPDGLIDLYTDNDGDPHEN